MRNGNRKLMCLLTGLFCLAMYGVDYNGTVDFVYGGKCYQELDGAYYGTSFNESSIAWPTRSGVVVVFGLHIPKGHMRADIVLLPKNGKTFKVKSRLVDPQDGTVLQEGEASFTNTSMRRDTVEILPDVVVPEDKWYRLELTGESASSGISQFYGLLFQRESSLPVVDSEVFMAPSVHLMGYRSTNSQAPSGDAYDWVYLEVMYPSIYEVLSTYVMSIGSDGQYGGIQSIAKSGGYNRQVIYSIWDHGDTDSDPNLPEYLRSGELDKGPDVYTTRFGGEGTGISARYPDGNWWNPDHWMQFLVYARPEAVEVTLDDGSTMTYENTLQTMWYKQDDETEWRYIATLRQSGINHLYDSFYSFIENFYHVGGEFFRRAYFRNPTMHSAAGGKWYPMNKVDFGHTQGTNSRRSRTDYGHGVTAMYDNCYYMQTGGFVATCDSSHILPLITGGMEWVDTIDMDALRSRVEQSYKTSMVTKMTSLCTGRTASALAGIANQFLADANHFDSYSSAELEPLRELAEADRNVLSSEWKKALLDLAENGTPLKYGIVRKTNHLNSFHSYVMEDASAGTYLVVDEGEVKKIELEALDVCNPCHNWYIVHDDGSSEFRIYNPGAGKYLTISSTLSDEAKVLRMGASEMGFRIRSGAYTLGTFSIYDNYAMKPDARLIRAIIDPSTDIVSPRSDETDLPDDNVLYDLMGRRVDNPSRGIYISNGKKIFIK
ncbi:MAG: DUF3472 domain-containing protein [Bacteroidaceae bacterium]|nr:DUF3472 domain-containing protein [Bacteroidaceae bacterium]